MSEMTRPLLQFSSELSIMLNELFAPHIPDITLYHYTRAPGLVGILSTKSLWTTDVRFMNDATELKYGTEKAANAINDRLSTNLSEVQKEFLKRGKNRDHTASLEIFAVCFCENGDLLSQWKGYTDSGGGYAIGFDLFPAAVSGKARLRRVYYSEAEQNEIISKVISVFLKICEMEYFARQDEELNNWMPTLLSIFDMHLTELATFLKHPSFSEEKEWRLLQIPPQGITDGLQFRSSGANVVPYRIWDWAFSAQASNNWADLVPYPVREIIVGPQSPQELNIRSVEMALRAAGAPRAVHARPSQIPYRPV